MWEVRRQRWHGEGDGGESGYIGGLGARGGGGYGVGGGFVGGGGGGESAAATAAKESVAQS